MASLQLIMICGNVAMFYPDVAIVGRWWWHRCNGSDSNVAMLYLDVAVLLCCDNKVPMFYLDVAIVGRWWWHRCNGSDNNLRQRSTQLLSLALPVVSSIMV